MQRHVELPDEPAVVQRWCCALGGLLISGGFMCKPEISISAQKNTPAARCSGGGETSILRL